MSRLQDRVAVITGAGRGIGAAIARRFSAEGARVAILELNVADGQQVAAELAQARAYPADVCDLAALRSAIDQVRADFGRLDILVNNAGITDDDLFIRMKPDAWTNVLRTNLDSAFNITQEVVKKMIRARWGRVINISSVVGLMGNAGQVNYASSKAALIGFTKSLALEIGSRNVTVNAVAPGFIQTSMTDAMTDDAKGKLEDRIALKRLGTPDDVARAALFLASEEAPWITGIVLDVTGGAVML